MPKPSEYEYPGRDFKAFLKDAQSELNSPTSNSTFTTVQSVLLVFRRRLSFAQAIAFASALSPVLRALFVQDWDISDPKREFEDMKCLNAEVLTLRANHNFSPENSIEKVANALWRHVDQSKLHSSLEKISTDALRFWGR